MYLLYLRWCFIVHRYLGYQIPVVPQFLNVPIDDAMIILLERLENDESLGDRTALTPDCICRLTELCLRSTYFAFQGNIYMYKQKEGTAMGSPLSPVIANLFMEDFETTALMTAELQPKIWKRYVDDTFVIWPHGRTKLNEFLSHINSLHHKITFTVEIEENNQLPFLDILIRRKHTSLETTVYRKPTNTNQYLNFRSHHHPRIKLGIVQCLTKRASSICSKHHLQQELDLLKEIFTANGFPEKKVEESIRKNMTSGHHKEMEEKNGMEKTGMDEEEKQPLLVLPYLQGLSEKISRTCRRLNIKTAFTSRPALRNLLVQVKGKPPSSSRLGDSLLYPMQLWKLLYWGSR